MHLLLSSLEARETHSAWSIYNLLEDLKYYLTAGTTKPTFQAETDQCVAKLPQNMKMQRRYKTISISILRTSTLVKGLSTRQKLQNSKGYTESPEPRCSCCCFYPHQLPIIFLTMWVNARTPKALCNPSPNYWKNG